MDISERALETIIENALIADGNKTKSAVHPFYDRAGLAKFGGPPGGFRKRKPEDYDRALYLDIAVVLEFIYATQPKEWDKLKKQHGEETKDRFLRRLASEIQNRGTVDVLRNGVKANGCAFKLAYFRPASGLNEESQRLYEANLFTVIRQLKYSERNEKSLDMALFLNGLPIITAELKNPFTGQNIQDAIRQYRLDRDPKEPLFAFGRCLAHFAVDPDLVYMSAYLEGPRTIFLPFNQGNGTGAGNPPSMNGFATAYLWEKIWTRDSLLGLIQHFIHVVEVEDDKGRKTGERKLIFPRYHQLDTVRRLVGDALELELSCPCFTLCMWIRNWAA